MNWALGIASYVVIWWVVLFAVLPWGVVGQHESGAIVPGTEPAAPVAPRLWFKLGVTTAIAAAVWIVLDVLYVVYWSRY